MNNIVFRSYSRHRRKFTAGILFIYTEEDGRKNRLFKIPFCLLSLRIVYADITPKEESMNLFKVPIYHQGSLILALRLHLPPFQRRLPYPADTCRVFLLLIVFVNPVIDLCLTNVFFAEVNRHFRVSADPPGRSLFRTACNASMLFG